MKYYLYSSKVFILLFLLLFISLVFHGGCVVEKSQEEYMTIQIDWSTLKQDTNSPIAACSFYGFSGVKLTIGPIEEIVYNEVYDGMEGYESGNINNRGNRVYKFLIRRVNKKVYSVILESSAKIKLNLINLPCVVYGINNINVCENSYKMDPGEYKFEIRDIYTYPE